MQELKAVAGSVSQLTLDLNEFRQQTKTELTSMGLRVKTIEETHSDVQSQISELQKNFESFKLGNPTHTESSVHPGNLTVISGNLPNAESVEKAQEFIRKMCVSAGIPQPADVFPKGEYKGLIWAKCTSISQRDVLISKIRNTAGEAGKKPWSKIDLPIDKRTAESTLFAFKRMLMEWGFANKAVRVDTDSCVLKVMDKEILKAKVSDFTMQLQWCDGEWETWQELQSSTEFDTLRKDAQDKLNRAKEWATDGGKGKGKSDSK